jgi:ketoreductase RED2
MTTDSAPVSLVIGGTSGIGAAVARRLAERGHRAVISGSRADPDIAAIGAAAFVRADLSHPGAGAQVVDEVLGEFGRLDNVVYAAGTTVKIDHADLAAADDEIWNRILRLNLLTPFEVLRTASSTLSAGGQGTFTAIGALSGVDAGGSSIPYAVSKAALHHMCKLTAAALGPGVRVNVVAPGFIDTPWSAGWGEFRQAVSDTVPLRRVGTPDDVADTVLGVIDSHYLTGQTIVLDGGLSLLV